MREGRAELWLLRRALEGVRWACSAMAGVLRANDDARRVESAGAGVRSSAARLIFAAAHAVRRHWLHDQPSDRRLPSRKRLCASRMTAPLSIFMFFSILILSLLPRPSSAPSPRPAMSEGGG